MNISLVLGYLAKGGTERQVAYLSSALAQRGHQVSILLLGHQLEDDYPVAPGVQVHELRITQLRHSLSGLRKLRAAFRSSDLVYSFLDLANGICALCKPGSSTPLVWGLRAANTGSSRLSRFGLALSRQLCNRADALIANSHAVRGYYQQQGVDHAQFWIVPNGVKPSDPSAKPAKWRLDNGLPVDAFVALVLARVAQEKRQALGLQLLQHNPRLHLVFAGDGATELPERWRQQHLADEALLARCTFVEHQSDVSALLGAADVLLSLSSSEGFPNAVLEAMAHGVPVVATAVGGVPELLAGEAAEGGALGWLVPMETPQADVKGLAQALSQVQAQGPGVQARIDQARRQVEEGYGVERMVDSTLTCLTRLLDARRSQTQG